MAAFFYGFRIKETSRIGHSLFRSFAIRIEHILQIPDWQVFVIASPYLDHLGEREGSYIPALSKKITFSNPRRLELGDYADDYEDAANVNGERLIPLLPFAQNATAGYGDADYSLI